MDPDITRISDEEKELLRQRRLMRKFVELTNPMAFMLYLESLENRLADLEARHPIQPSELIDREPPF